MLNAKCDMFQGPLSVMFTFVMPRPNGHFGTKGLKPSAPDHPTTKPDALKLCRSTEDALTGVVWNDDSQTVQLDIEKRYAAVGEAPGARIVVANI